MFAGKVLLLLLLLLRTTVNWAAVVNMANSFGCQWKFWQSVRRHKIQEENIGTHSERECEKCIISHAIGKSQNLYIHFSRNFICCKLCACFLFSLFISNSVFCIVRKFNGMRLNLLLVERSKTSKFCVENHLKILLSKWRGEESVRVHWFDDREIKK